MALETELETYKQKLHELKENEGKFVLIHKDDVVDIFSTYDDAIKSGYQKFGLQPFLVKQIHSIEQIHASKLIPLDPVPHFTLQIVQSGPIVKAIVSVSQARSAALTTAGVAIPPVVPIQALIDTGASCTCVDLSVIRSLQLTPTGSVPMLTPSTGTQPAMMNQYDVGIIIPGPSTNHSPFVLHTLAVVETALFAAQGFHALIGRDVLQHCVLTYNGSMTMFTLAY